MTAGRGGNVVTTLSVLTLVAAICPQLVMYCSFDDADGDVPVDAAADDLLADKGRVEIRSDIVLIILISLCNQLLVKVP